MCITPPAPPGPTASDGYAPVDAAPEARLLSVAMPTPSATMVRKGMVLDAGVAGAHFVSTMPFPVVNMGSAPVSSSSEIMIAGHDEPIGVRGVAVFPGDIIVGDENGAVCIPRHMAADVAQAAVETEALEEYVPERIRAGGPIDGTYPPDTATLAACAAWRAARDGAGA